MPFKWSDLRSRDNPRGISWRETLGLLLVGCSGILVADRVLGDPEAFYVIVAIAAGCFVAIRLLHNRPPK
jgi:hypothetical protein